MHRGTQESELTEPGMTTWTETRPNVYLQRYLSLSKRLQVMVVSLVPLISCFCLLLSYLIAGKFPLISRLNFSDFNFYSLGLCQSDWKAPHVCLPQEQLPTQCHEGMSVLSLSELNMLSFLPIPSEGTGFFLKPENSFVTLT